jgi:hypothetical protein
MTVTSRTDGLGEPEMLAGSTVAPQGRPAVSPLARPAVIPEDDLVTDDQAEAPVEVFLAPVGEVLESPGVEVIRPAGRRRLGEHRAQTKDRQRRHQRRMRLLVAAGLAGAAGLTVLAMIDAQSSSSPGGSTVPVTTVPAAVNGIGTAGLVPTIQPPATLPPPG